MTKQIPSMQKFARMGATVRLRQLQEEVDAIVKAFPDLKRGAASNAKRSRRKLTEAQKKAISVRMKATWAKREQSSRKVP